VWRRSRKLSLVVNITKDCWFAVTSADRGSPSIADS
jgi:hypothetical protein